MIAILHYKWLVKLNMELNKVNSAMTFILMTILMMYITCRRKTNKKSIFWIETLWIMLTEKIDPRTNRDGDIKNLLLMEYRHVCIPFNSSYHRGSGNVNFIYYWKCVHSLTTELLQARIVFGMNSNICLEAFEKNCNFQTLLSVDLRIKLTKMMLPK